MSRSRIQACLAAIAFCGVSLFAGTVQAQSKVQQAVDLAQQTGRPILLLATGTWCQPCQQLKQRFATEPELQTLSSDFICVNLDIEADERDFAMWESQFSTTTNGIPKVYIVTAQGEQLYNGGAYEGEGLNRLLTQSLATSREKTEAITAAQLAEMEAAQGIAPGGVAAEPAEPFGQQVVGEPAEAAAPAEPAEPNPFGPQPAQPAEPAAVAEAEPATPPVRRPVREPNADEEPREISRAQLNRRLDGWLRMATSFSDSRPEKTREYVARIVEAAPDSPQAAQAQALLDSLD